jgi:hypothetical protein
VSGRRREGPPRDIELSVSGARDIRRSLFASPLPHSRPQSSAPPVSSFYGDLQAIWC